MEIVVTSVGGDGTVYRAAVDTAGRADADRWEQLAASAHLEVPPPYQPEPGQAVYEIRAGEHVAQVAEQNLAGPLRELVIAVLTESGNELPVGSVLTRRRGSITADSESAYRYLTCSNIRDGRNMDASKRR